jgi:broad specificity phosphatase PhoE
VLVLAAVLALVAPAVAHAQKLVILVRHAERADGGSMSPNAQSDPALSAAGEARAQKLATMLAQAGITTIFTTEYKRTKDTGGPLATKLHVTPTVVAADKTDALIASIKTHTTEIVLVVGHSNTIPDLVKAFGGPEITVPDAEYDNIFFVVPATATLTRLKF